MCVKHRLFSSPQKLFARALGNCFLVHERKPFSRTPRNRAQL
jgi:hypothetical protein